MNRMIPVACVLLAGCAGMTSVVPSMPRSAATWSSMIYAAKDGPIWVELRGEALGAPAESFAALTAQAMTGAVLGYATTFTADPGQAPHRNFRTVMVLDPLPAMTDRDACAGRIAGLSGPAGQLSVLAVFCNGQEVLSSAQGHVTATAPGDAAVAALMRALTQEIFQEERLDDDGRDSYDAG